MTGPERTLAALTAAGGWITAAALAPIVGCGSAKTIQGYIIKLRRDGHSVASSADGYRLVEQSSKSRPARIARPSGKSCADCSAPISRGSKKGRCQACALVAMRNDPTVQQRRREGLAKATATPEYRAAFLAGAKRGAAKRMDNPDYRARLVSQGRMDMGQCRTAEARTKAVAALKDTKNGWCPVHLREFNEQLRAAKYLLAERKVIVADEAERLERLAAEAEQRRVASMSPFERQLEAVRNGRGLVAKFVPRAADPAYTLGGVSEMAA